MYYMNYGQINYNKCYMKLLKPDALTTKKTYALHLLFKLSTAKEQIEKEISGYIKQIIIENGGEKVHDFENNGKLELYYQIKKNTSAVHYIWHFDIIKSFMDMKIENIGTRLSRIQRKIKEKYENNILRLMLLS